MSAWNSARLVEARGLAILQPFLNEKANGKLVMLDKGPLARALQQTVGDAIFQCPKGRAWSVEFKCEEEETGNLFLESWSNRNLEDKDSHMERGSNPGWMFTNRADLLLYYFLETDNLYVLDFLRLKRWAFEGWRIAQYTEKPHGKRIQKNDSWGWCVPVDILDFEGIISRVLNPKRLAAEQRDLREAACPF